MLKYLLFLASTLVMVGIGAGFRERLIERQGDRPAQRSEQHVSLKVRVEKTANEVLGKVMDASAIVEQSIALGTVDQLVIEGTASVRISQGTENSLIIRSPAFSKDSMKHRQEGKKLTLNGISIPSFVGTLQSEYELTLVDIKDIKLYGTGNLNGLTPFTLETLEINNSGTGIISMNIASEELTLSINGSGNIHIDGRTEELSAKILGSGNIRSRALNGQEATVRVSGSGNADLGRFEEVDANILGSGNVSCIEGARLDVNSIGTGSLYEVPPPAAEPAAIPAPVESPAEIPAP